MKTDQEGHERDSRRMSTGRILALYIGASLVVALVTLIAYLIRGGR